MSQKTSKEVVTFSYVQTESQPDQTCIGINDGKFAGVVYKYGKITPIENEDGGLTMQFEFDILENNAIPREQFGNDFFDIIGDILMEILDEKYRKDDLSKSNSQ